jgi:Ni,Fe-hydrogenase I small subunit
VTSTDPQPDTPPFAEIDVLWITAGLGCDGDTISVTAATQPSLEDILLGGIPWIPKVNFHNPVLAYANGEAVSPRRCRKPVPHYPGHRRIHP